VIGARMTRMMGHSLTEPSITCSRGMDVVLFSLTLKEQNTFQSNSST